MGTCLVLDLPSLPTLPSPISLSFAAPIPALPGQPQFCCKLPDVAKFIMSQLPPIPGQLLFGGTFGIPLFATLNTYITALNTYLRAIPLNCPLE